MMMVSGLESSQIPSKEPSILNARSSSALKPSRRSSPFLSSSLPNPRRAELSSRFGFSSSQLQIYEKMLNFMRKLSEEQKSDLIAELLRKSN
jgi:hypothetical protein